MKEKRYQINDMFYSLQGEGVRAGTAAVFLRFSGCNLSCAVKTHGFDCDTEFVSGRAMSREEIVAQIDELSSGCSWVICTGGEPLLQLDEDLASILKEHGYHLALETNGSFALSDSLQEMFDWVVCSPKVAEHAIKLTQCDELRYVRAAGQGVPKPKLRACIHKLLSPAFCGDEMDIKALQWCIELVKSSPEWRLSIQQHKIWGIR